MGTALYLRMSIDRDGTGAGVERQRQACEEVAERNNLAVDHVLVDNDTSATTGTRPEFTRLVRLVEDGLVSTIIVWATDRLYRRVRDLVELVELAETHSLRILTVKSGDLDLSTPAGRMLAGMLGHAARFEVEQKGARQVAANVQRANAGKWMFARRPYGYRRVDGKVVQVPEEAAVLRRMYEAYLAGETYYSIGEALNRDGIPAQGGGKWSTTQVRSRLLNPHYAGIVEYRGQRVDVEPEWEPIISREEWGRFEAATIRRQVSHDWANATKHLLSGIPVCGVCGGRVMARPEYRRTKSGERSTVMTLACHANWCVSRLMGPVEQVVEGVVLRRLMEPDAAELIRPSVDVAPLYAEAEDLRARRDELAQLLADGVLGVQAVRDASTQLQARLEAVQARIGALSGDGALASVVSGGDVEAAWSRLPLGGKRSIISALVDVTVYRQRGRTFDPDALRVEWKR